MSDVSFAFAFILGTFLECVMYGGFLILLIAACYVQWVKYSKRRGVNRVLAFTTVFFGSTITTICILSVYRSMRAIFYAPAGDIYQFLDPPYPPSEVIRLSMFQFQIVVADIIMVHRMYYVYDKNFFVCIIPSITIAGLFAVACATTHQFMDLSTPYGQKILGNWSWACFCLTIFNSLFMTIGISFKLWRVHRETASANIQVNGSVILRSMKVLIESAALWTTFVVINFIAYLAKTNLVFVSLAMTSPAVGISFCLIIVRLGQVLPEQQEESWHMTVRPPGTLTSVISTPASTADSKTIPFDVEIPRAGYIDRSSEPPKVIRASLNIQPSLTL